MAVNDSGTKVVVFGGMLDSNNPATDIWVLDVPTLIWTMGPLNQQPRWNHVCAFAGNTTFVAWGGMTRLCCRATTKLGNPWQSTESFAQAIDPRSFFLS